VGVTSTQFYASENKTIPEHRPVVVGTYQNRFTLRIRKRGVLNGGGNPMDPDQMADSPHGILGRLPVGPYWQRRNCHEEEMGKIT